MEPPEKTLKKMWHRGTAAMLVAALILPALVALTAENAWADVPVRNRPWEQKALGGPCGAAIQGSGFLGGIFGGALSSLADTSGIPASYSEDLNLAYGGLPNPCSDWMAYTLAQLLLHALSQSLVNWIRTGGINGNPLYVQNFGDFFGRELDNAAGVFLEKVTSPQFMNLICSPFRIQLGSLLNASLLRRGGFDQRARCTLTQIVNNLENFQIDFTQGGWGGWVALLEPNNNPIGSYLRGLDEVERRERKVFLASAYETLTTGGGLLAYKDCSKALTPSGQINRSKCETVTPGGVVAKAMQDVYGIDVERLQLAREIDQIVAASLDAIMSWMVTGGGGDRGFARFDLNAFNQSADATFKQQRNLVFSQIQGGLAVETNYLATKQNSLQTASTTIHALQELLACKNSKPGQNQGISEIQKQISDLTATTTRLAQDIGSAKSEINQIERRISDVSATQNQNQLSFVVPAVRNTLLQVHDPAPAQAELTQLQSQSSSAANDLNLCQAAPNT